MCKNKKVFITGATTGIGLAVALAYEKQGAIVVGTGTSKKLNDYPWGYFQADFTKKEDLLNCKKYIEEYRPDILINNAGINKVTPFLEIKYTDFINIQNVNLVAPFLFCQAALPSMVEKKWGRIVNVASIWGKISRVNRASYSASKFALDGMTLALALEYASRNVLINCVAPGFTDTNLTRRTLSEYERSGINANVPIGRMATVEEIAKFILWLGSGENTYIAGQNIAIDGAFSRAG